MVAFGTIWATTAVICGTLVQQTVAAARTTHGGVHVDLEANEWASDVFWPARETAEYLYSELESDTIFWDYVDHLELCSSGQSGETPTSQCAEISAQQVETAVFEFLAERLSDPDLRALKLALAYRANLPAVVSQTNGETAVAIRAACGLQNAAEGAEPQPANAWGLLNGEQPVCSVEELNVLLQACGDGSGDSEAGDSGGTCYAPGESARLSPPVLRSMFPYDYVFHGTNPTASAGWLTVFGTVGTPELRTLVAAAKRAAADGAVHSVMLRHSPTYAGAQTVVPQVPGFGIALDIKNMEYKTIDDRVVATSESDEDGDPLQELRGDESEVNGIFFSRVAERRPELAKQLRVLKDHLVSETAASASEVKVWNMRYMGVAATQRIVRMSQGHRGSFDSSLSKLQDLSQNFPLHVASLTSDKIAQETKDELAGRAHPSSPWHRLGIGEGSSALWINGVEVGSPSSTGFDVHDVINTIGKEQRLTKMFNELPLPDTEVKTLQRLAARGFQSSSGSIRVDVRSGAKGALHFLNNLEKDGKYKYWERELSAILQPSWQLPQIAANFYTAIVIADPATPSGLRAVADAFELYNANAPIRIGFCFTNGESAAETEPLDVDESAVATTRHIVRLVQAAKQKYSHRAASAFLEYLTNQAFELDLGSVDDGETFTVGHLIEIFAKAAKHAEKAWRSASYSEDAKTVLSGDSYENKKGETVVAPDEQYRLAREFAVTKGLVPGHVTLNGMVEPEAALDGSIQGAMNLVLKDMRYIQKLVSLGKLRTGDNILQVLLKKSAFPRFQHDILSTGFNSNPVPFPTADPETSDLAGTPFFYPSHDAADADAAGVSFAIVSNWDSVTGIDLALGGLRHLRTLKDVTKNSIDFFSLHRVALIDSGQLSHQSGSLQAKAIGAIHALAAEQKRTSGGDAVLDSAIVLLERLRKSIESANDDDLAAFEAALPESTDVASSGPARASATLFKLEPGSNAVVVNGHLVIASQPWSAADFELLATQELRYRSRRLGKHLQQQFMPNSKVPVESVPAPLKAGPFAAICATLGLYAETSRKTQFPEVSDFPLTSVQQQLSENGSDDNAIAGTSNVSDQQSDTTLQVVVAVDPVSEAAQRLSALLQSLRDILNDAVQFTVFLNPKV